MNKPNFFIIGAPKSGTTALSEYLREHRNIYFSYPKEPYFFCPDIIKNRPVKTTSQYLSLFSATNSDHIAIGEGSVYYLYSCDAIKKIYGFSPEAKLIIMLRNPIDLVYSLYSQFIVNGTENADSFQQAWDMQSDRLKGLKLPIKQKDIPLTQYGAIGLLGEQVKRVLGIFPRRQVQLIFFDDFKTNTGDIYKQVLSFLNVPDDGRETFPVVNANKAVYSKHYMRFLDSMARNQYNQLLLSIFKKYIFKDKDRLNIIPFIRSLNFKEGVDRDTLPDSFKYELSEFFKKDIRLLSDFTEKDLQHWQY